MAISLFRHMFDRYSSAVWFFDSERCSVARGGSHPISNSLGAKPVVEFLLLLLEQVVTDGDRSPQQQQKLHYRLRPE